MSEAEFDLVVAGAGMTGATLALAVAQAGLRVAVVDALPPDASLAPTFDGRASAIAYANFRQWRAVGLAEALEPHAQPLRAIVVSDGSAPGAATRRRGPAFLRFDGAEIADRNDGEPLAWMIENRRIRAAVGAALAAAPGVEVFAPVAVRGVEADARRARVRLADGRTLAAPLAVGAEGRASAVREAAGVRTMGWRYGQKGVVATVALERPHEGVAHELFMGAGALAVLPLTEDRASLVWNEPEAMADALVAGSPEAFEAHLARRFGDFLGRPRLQGPRFAYPLGLMVAERIVGARVALVGDAAHVVHPIAGQGLNLGLKDVAALAEVVVDARRLGEDWGADAVLDRYARWRRFDQAGMAVATDAFIRLFAPANPLAATIRAAGLALMNRAAPVRRLFMLEAGGGLGELPRLLRGEPLA
jgi:2-octaprenyl-6-methoxyphenol hydroxylase